MGLESHWNKPDSQFYIQMLVFWDSWLSIKSKRELAENPKCQVLLFSLAGTTCCLLFESCQAAVTTDIHMHVVTRCM